MNRREVIKSLGYISFHVVFPSTLASFLSSCKTVERPQKSYSFFTIEQVALIKEVIDIIIPETITKSASEVGVHFFLDEVFDKCLTTDQKTLIFEGIEKLSTEWNNTNKKTCLTKLDQQAFENNEEAAWFKTLKRYTLIGFFTSQEGTQKAGNYEKIPDKYIGEISITSSTLAHSKTFLKYYF